MALPITQPYEVRNLIGRLPGDPEATGQHPVEISCAQAFGSEIYVGCSNGELLRYALQVDNPNKPETYSLISRQSVPGDKAVQEIVLLPCIARALIRSDHQIHFYTFPALDAIPAQVTKPIKNVVALAVDYNALKRPPLRPSASINSVPPVDFCIVKRASISLYQLRDILLYQKEIPLPSGAILARRIGMALLIADKETYSIVHLKHASLQELLPVSQDIDRSRSYRPHISIVGDHEFLLCSWTGAGTMGLFVDDTGNPIRGTINWPSHPKSISVEYPHVTALLSNGTIEVHDIETPMLDIIQVISAPEEHETTTRSALAACLGGYAVPVVSSAKMQMVPVPLIR